VLCTSRSCFDRTRFCNDDGAEPGQVDGVPECKRTSVRESRSSLWPSSRTQRRYSARHDTRHASRRARIFRIFSQDLPPSAEGPECATEMSVASTALSGRVRCLRLPAPTTASQSRSSQRSKRFGPTVTSRAPRSAHRYRPLPNLDLLHEQRQCVMALKPGAARERRSASAARRWAARRWPLAGAARRVSA
jgi:hypothetical protein